MVCLLRFFWPCVSKFVFVCIIFQFDSMFDFNCGASEESGMFIKGSSGQPPKGSPWYLYLSVFHLNLTACQISIMGLGRVACSLRVLLASPQKVPMCICICMCLKFICICQHVRFQLWGLGEWHVH